MKFIPRSNFDYEMKLLLRSRSSCMHKISISLTLKNELFLYTKQKVIWRRILNLRRDREREGLLFEARILGYGVLWSMKEGNACWSLEEVEGWISYPTLLQAWITYLILSNPCKHLLEKNISYKRDLENTH